MYASIECLLIGLLVRYDGEVSLVVVLAMSERQPNITVVQELWSHENKPHADTQSPREIERQTGIRRSTYCEMWPASESAQAKVQSEALKTNRNPLGELVGN